MSQKFRNLILLIVTGAFCLAIVNLCTGFSNLQFVDFFSDSDQFSIAHLRINRTLAMALVGISIPTSGFVLQEYFQNPLAGPSVLGITSIASLAVALYVFFSQNLTLPVIFEGGLLSFAAFAGSCIFMGILLFFSGKFKDSSYLIIFGFLISALSGAVISVLQLYADDQSLKNYILWSFGANNQITNSQLLLLFLLTIGGIFFTFLAIKPLIGNALGENYAKSFGINLANLKYFVIISSSLLASSVTAFLGPILFVGIMVPHFCRMIWNPAKLWEQWLLNMVLGICIMQFFSVISELSQFPINIITSMFGIPVILMMMLKKVAY